MLNRFNGIETFMHKSFPDGEENKIALVNGFFVSGKLGAQPE